MRKIFRVMLWLFLAFAVLSAISELKKNGDGYRMNKVNVKSADLKGVTK